MSEIVQSYHALFYLLLQDNKMQALFKVFTINLPVFNGHVLHVNFQQSLCYFAPCPTAIITATALQVQCVFFTFGHIQKYLLFLMPRLYLCLLWLLLLVIELIFINSLAVMPLNSGSISEHSMNE